MAHLYAFCTLPRLLQVHATLKTAADYEQFLTSAIPSLPVDAVRRAGAAAVCGGGGLKNSVLPPSHRLQLFMQLATQGLFYRLPPFELAARELPVTGIGLSDWA